MTRDEMDEIKRHFDIVAEGLGSRIGAVAGGPQILAEGQGKLLQRMEGLEHRIDRLESEIKAMLRLSFAELERRVLGLEAIVIKLVERVDRLEAGSSH